MADFQLGDLAETMDDVLRGTVVAVGKDTVTLEMEEGFQLDFAPSELVRISGQQSIKVSNYEVAKIKSEKEKPGRPKPSRKRPREGNQSRMEVDLHIEKLHPSPKGMSNYDILNLQMDTAKRQLEFAMGKGIQRVVFIHGVGEGVLKEELKYLFARYDRIRYYEADYRTYGAGATEVFISQTS